MQVAVAVGFGRRCGVGIVAAVLAALAHQLLVPENVDLVARRHLRRDAAARVLPGLVVERLTRLVRNVQPRVRVARVLVVVHVRDVRGIALRARRAEEPQPISPDGRTDGSAQVVTLDERARRDVELPQFVVQVAALQMAVRPRSECTRRQLVATRLRHDVHYRTAGLDLAEAAGRREVDLLRVARVGQIVGPPGLGNGDADAVHEQPRFGVGTATREQCAVCAERARVARTGADVLLAAEDAGHEHQQRVVAARRWNRVDHFVRENRLALGPLEIDDGRFARDRDGLLEGTDGQLDGDGGGHRPRQFEAFALDGREAAERELHAVDARPKVFNTVLPRPVGDGGADLLNQRRARRLDGHTRQYSARQVLDRAR